MRNCLRKRGRLESGGFNVKQRVLRFFCGQRSEAAPLGLEVDWERMGYKRVAPLGSPVEGEGSQWRRVRESWVLWLRA
jgi:hypothetical protein